MWLIGIKTRPDFGRVYFIGIHRTFFTKWAAIAYQMLIDEYGYDKNDQMAVWEKFTAYR